MKSLQDVTVSILQDCGMQCGANPIRDILTVTRRTEHEGDSFLTITLPAFCRDFERSLAEGFLSPALSSRFRSRRGTCLPRFLGGFMERIFSPRGALLEVPDETCILAVRQICLLHQKTTRPCSKERMANALSGFLQTESSVRNHVMPSHLRHTFIRVSKVVWSDILGDLRNSVGYQELKPRHGPGTTREGLRGNGKFAFASWPSRLESVFPFSEFGIASIRNPEGEDRVSRISYTSARDEPPVKVCLVPKTLKSPRVIAIEPVCMQYMQQAISDWLRPRIELRGRYTSGHVNFRDQKVNANLALKGSADGSLATIDMSDASDRISCKHVRDMLRISPTFSRWVFATRSSRAQLPGDDTSIVLRKFASMGSALCFPIEAMVFYCAIISILIQNAGVRISPRSVRKFSERVYVYGDDLVVPADMAPSVCAGLEAFGFKVNSGKTFWTGRFRESCGTDAYNGRDITPVYCRMDIPTHRTDVDEIVSAVALANQLYWAGYWSTARMVRLEVEKLLGVLPSITTRSQGLGWQSFSEALSFNGWSQDYQRPKLRCYVPTPTMRHDPLEDDAALLKCFGLIGSHTVDPRHLTTSVRYGNLALKRRWS